MQLTDPGTEHVPRCCVCDRQMNADVQTCEGCEAHTLATLRHVLEVWAVLPVALFKTGSPGDTDRVSGSGESPIPGGTALVITSAGRDLQDDPEVRMANDPQPLVAELTTWEDDWRELKGDTPRRVERFESSRGDRRHVHGQRHAINRAVKAAGRYLAGNNAWAALHHPAYDEYVKRLRRTLRQMEHLLGQDRYTEYLAIPCPHCTGQLVRENGKEQVDCVSCRRSWPREDYRRLQLIVASERQNGAMQ